MPKVVYTAVASYVVTKPGIWYEKKGVFGSIRQSTVFTDSIALERDWTKFPNEVSFKPFPIATELVEVEAGTLPIEGPVLT